MARWFTMLFVLALVVQTTSARDVPKDKGGLADQKISVDIGGVGGIGGNGSNGLPFVAIGGLLGGGSGTGGGLGGVTGTVGLGNLGGTGGFGINIGGLYGNVIPSVGYGTHP